MPSEQELTTSPFSQRPVVGASIAVKKLAALEYVKELIRAGEMPEIDVLDSRRITVIEQRLDGYREVPSTELVLHAPPAVKVAAAELLISNQDEAQLVKGLRRLTIVGLVFVAVALGLGAIGVHLASLEETPASQGE